MKIVPLLCLLLLPACFPPTTRPLAPAPLPPAPVTAGRDTTGTRYAENEAHRVAAWEWYAGGGR